MSESQDKKRTTEWSFSFEQLGESISQWVGSLKGGEVEVQVDHFTAPVDGATSARVELNMAIGKVTVDALSGSDNLMEAEVGHVGEMEFTVSGDEEKRVKLGQKQPKGGIRLPFKEAINAIGSRDDLLWTVGLSPNVPMRLKINAGLGASSLDLSELQITDLDVDAGVGEVQLTLPAMGESYKAEVDSGVGSIRITIPENAALKLDIDGGVGSTTVSIPHNAAVRIKADSGLGGIHLPDHFMRVKKGDDFVTKSGVWETEGFAVAARQIVIHYDGGIGGLKVE
ncbi:MAG: hypothetical protein H6672_06580 [Anaerolineaceae bacterium]|nr:hypothetical protein [Anaerolineaceae bacterium]